MESLQGVSNTLFIPLAARVFASKKIPEYFYDEKSLSMEKYIPGDRIQKKSSEYSFMASVARYYNMDHIVQSFIAKHQKGNIVYLGAGLDTASYRLHNHSALFYAVDLPEVIDLRRSILGEQENERLVSGDIDDTVWIHTLNKAFPSLLVASGVFQYFTEDRVMRLITNIKTNLKDVELLFDAANETGIKYANRYVKKTGNANALMHFYINDGIDFARKTGTVLLEERVFFTDARRILAKKLGLYTRIAMRVVDDKKRAIIIHLKIN
ncbi:MAG: class I SAM-dependent methyltransferase [Spirochaetaceae bacterium]|jgi:O-methyltransferase involved in polyketide biosynthesis|nr:class I SAM-dependent methyltransferase [Spirochaetaceae bacterium]